MAIFGLGTAALFGAGLWLWVAEERILRHTPVPAPLSTLRVIVATV